GGRLALCDHDSTLPLDSTPTLLPELPQLLPLDAPILFLVLGRLWQRFLVEQLLEVLAQCGFVLQDGCESWLGRSSRQPLLPAELLGQGRRLGPLRHGPRGLLRALVFPEHDPGPLELPAERPFVAATHVLPPQAVLYGFLEALQGHVVHGGVRSQETNLVAFSRIGPGDHDPKGFIPRLARISGDAIKGVRLLLLSHGCLSDDGRAVEPSVRWLAGDDVLPDSVFIIPGPLRIAVPVDE